MDNGGFFRFVQDFPQNPQDIAASIKALAKSVHGEHNVFGDLPRPRFSTQLWFLPYIIVLAHWCSLVTISNKTAAFYNVLALFLLLPEKHT